MTYKEHITSAMNTLAADERTRFIGYGLKRGRCAGTIAAAKESQIVETTVAENLMVGIAAGYAVRGYKPVVYIERMDFLLNCLDAIVNHAEKLHRLSDGQFSSNIIFRIVVGNSQKPLYTGPTHTQDLSESLALMVNFPVICLTKPELIRPAYENAYQTLHARSCALIEYKDMLL